MMNQTHAGIITASLGSIRRKLAAQYLDIITIGSTAVDNF